MNPTIGRIVQYTLSEQDAANINARRAELGAASANFATAGDVLPMIIVRVRGETPDAYVNGQVLVDGTFAHWVTSVRVGEGQRTYAWPARS